MKTLLAALGGAIVGAGCALLFAPQTGNATRSLIKDKATEYTHEVQDFVESKSRHLANKAKGYRHMAGDMADRGQELLDEGKEAIGMGTSNTNAPSDTALV